MPAETHQQARLVGNEEVLGLLSEVLDATMTVETAATVMARLFAPGGGDHHPAPGRRVVTGG
jgi:hypothetical protein